MVDPMQQWYLQCLARFVQDRGGSIFDGEVSEFYSNVPEARGVCKGLKSLLMTHGSSVGLYWVGRAQIVYRRLDAAVPRGFPAANSGEGTLNQHYLRLLSAFVQERGNSIFSGEVSGFFTQHPAAKSMLRPVKTAILRFGSAVGLVWQSSSNRDRIIYVRSADAEPPLPSSPAGTDGCKRHFLQLLSSFVQLKGNNISSGAVGSFFDQYPEAKDSLKPLRRTINSIGSRVGLFWRISSNRDRIVYVHHPDTASPAVNNEQAHFEGQDPGIFQHDLVEEKFICTVPAAVEVLETVLKDAIVIALDLEGDLRSSGRISLIQVAVAPHHVFVFDVLECPDIMSEAGLADLLRRPDLVKVFHACHADSAALAGQFNVTLENVFDTQAAYSVLKNLSLRHRKPLNVILKDYASGYINPHKDDVRHGPGVWEQRPLPPILFKYAVADVKFLIEAYSSMVFEATAANVLDECWKRSKMNVDEHVRTAQRRQKALARHKVAAAAFWADIQSDESLRLHCEDRVRFMDEYIEWRIRNGHEQSSASQVLQILVRQKRVKVVGDVLLWCVRDTSANAFAETAKRVHENRQEIESDKFGITVSGLKFEQVVSPGNHVDKTITVTNNGGVGCTFTCMDFLSSRLTGFLLLPSSSGVLPMSLDPGQVFVATVRFQSQFSGLQRTILRLDFELEESQSVFSIGRFLEARSGNALVRDMLKPTAPFKRRREYASVDEHAYVPGEDLPAQRMAPWIISLPHFKIPPLWKIMVNNGEAEAELEKTSTKTSVQASMEHLTNLLYCHELQEIRDLHSFDMMGTLLRHRGAYLELNVPGLSQGRPTVLRGDTVLVKKSGSAGDKTFCGIAHSVQRDAVLLKFSRSFHSSYSSYPVDVRFTLRRSSIRLCHQGVSLISQLRREVVSPEASFLPSQPDVSLPIVNWTRALNAEQERAVCEIVSARSIPFPYVIYGPPGTGKTATLIESIKQVILNRPDVKVLACAPTNDAADLIVERLADLFSASSSDMLRIMAHHRNCKTIPDSVLRFSQPFNRDTSSFDSVELAYVLRRRVVVSTICTSSKLYNLGVERGHFGMICIDESGQATEPELMSVVAALLGSEGQLVLAGDPKQLGPVVRSPIASRHGLGTSYLEHLIQRPGYAPDHSRFPETSGFNPVLITKLVRNYRSHPMLLNVPNQLFYESELVPCADPAISYSLANWEHLPKKGVPLIFHGVEGSNEREANSPSWFNSDEAAVVLESVELLCSSSPIVPSQIGVITPYSKQAEKLRMLLKANDFGEAKVGSVEQFQGQERRVIIISTVRSSMEYIESDVEHNLGFLSNAKRFNVAATRAQALMILIGSPTVLSTDMHWGALLQHCFANGACVGSPLPAQPNSSDFEDLQNRMEKLSISLTRGASKLLSGATNLASHILNALSQSNSSERSDD